MSASPVTNLIAPLEAVFMEMPFPVSLTEERSGFVFINGAFERKYGYTLDALYGRRSSVLTAGDAVANEGFFQELHTETRKSGWSGRLVNCSKTGKRMNIGLRTMMLAAPYTSEKVFLGVACDAGNEDMRDRAMLDLLMKRLVSFTSPAGALPALTKRQREIEKLLCAGFTYKGIACELGISHSTVKVQVSELRKILGAERIPLLRRA